MNLIATKLVKKFGLEVHDHPIPYPQGWVNKDVEFRARGLDSMNL